MILASASTAILILILSVLNVTTFARPSLAAGEAACIAPNNEQSAANPRKLNTMATTQEGPEGKIFLQSKFVVGTATKPANVESGRTFQQHMTGVKQKRSFQVPLGKNACNDPVTNRQDPGYPDNHRGWYDVQGCGRCNDYCRWVGGCGSGGDPVKRLDNSGQRCDGWWSCRLAGTASAYSPKGHFSSWSLMKCSTEGAVAPAQIPAATPYLPGAAGAPWTKQEILDVRAKLHRMFMEGGTLVRELGLPNEPDPWYAWPDVAKVLRLGFHDCLKYKDGTGGCDGCLEWTGAGHRFPRNRLRKGLINGSKRPDGHNNGLGYTIHVLDAIYVNRAFPDKTPLLPISLQDSGKSRADLIALAVMEAVKYGLKLYDATCGDAEAVRKLGINQCNPRASMSGCEASLPRELDFKTGRKDCVSTGFPWKTSSSPSFMTDKPEEHPNPNWNGSQTVAFFKSQFNFTGRETVAIMGAHTLGRVHVTISLMRYTWKARSGWLFNNGYFRNMARKEDWYYDSWHTDRKKPCAKSTTANSSNQRPIARWMPHVRKDTTFGGPAQWLQEKFVCPNCEALDVNGNEYKRCCGASVPRGSCKPGCERWKFVSGLDETMLNSDIGLYLNFNSGADGIPSGCHGFENFNQAGWRDDDWGWLNVWTQINGHKAEPRCGFQTLNLPAGSTPLYQVVEEYANDNSKFLNDFLPTLEKMLTNGYSANDLISAPSGGMSGPCELQSLSNRSRRYNCKDPSPAGPTDAPCTNDASCVALMSSRYGCAHATYGALIRSLCPVSCGCTPPSCCALLGEGGPPPHS